MGNVVTRISAAPVGDADHYCESQNMKVGALTLTATLTPGGASPTARYVTCTRTIVGAADTPGTLTIVGKDLTGSTITESLTPGANGILVTGTKLFRSVSSVTGVGWAIAEGNDTIIVGMAAENFVAQGSGRLHAVYLAVTHASTVTFTHAGGTLFVMPTSDAVGYKQLDMDFSGYLRVESGGTQDLFVIHSGSQPSSYALS